MRSRCCPLGLLGLVALVVGALPPRSGEACTTFLLQDGQEVLVGKSYDWDLDQGHLVINKRQVAKAAIPMHRGDRPAQWTSKYASVTFNQVGRELPNGGMNEAGLVVEIMWLNQSVFPKPDARPTVNELQLIQYLLDRYATVAEVVAQAPAVRVSRVYAKVHYLVCDRTGACAALELLGGRLRIAKGPTVKVLTNHPYAESAAFLQQHRGFGGTRAIPGGRGSLARFVRASDLVRRGRRSKSLLQDAVKILDSVKQGTYTKWGIVYDPRRGRISFRTLRAPALRHLDLATLDPACTTPVQYLDLNAKLVGNLHQHLRPYSTAANTKLVRSTIKALKAPIPEAAALQLARYPDALRCTSPDRRKVRAPASPR